MAGSYPPTRSVHRMHMAWPGGNYVRATTLAKEIVTAEIFMRLISSAVVWYRASVWHRRDPRHCASGVRVADWSRCRMISHDRAARINLMNISAVTIFLARVVLRISTVPLFIITRELDKLNRHILHVFSGDWTTQLPEIPVILVTTTTSINDNCPGPHLPVGLGPTHV